MDEAFETVSQDGDVDAAADFLAREQEELGDLGHEMGLSDGHEMGQDDGHGGNTPSPQFFRQHEKPEVEPESIKKWREDRAKMMELKDENEIKEIDLLRDRAKKELSDWYENYNEQLIKTKEANRQQQNHHIVAEINDIQPGTEWDRVAKLCDFNVKSSRHCKDMSRMRQILLQLKQSPQKT